MIILDGNREALNLDLALQEIYKDKYTPLKNVNTPAQLYTLLEVILSAMLDGVILFPESFNMTEVMGTLLKFPLYEDLRLAYITKAHPTKAGFYIKRFILPNIDQQEFFEEVE